MKKRKTMSILLIIILAVFTLLLAGGAYYGAFSKIDFRMEEQGGEMLVYEEITGDYSRTPAVMDKVCQALLNDEKIATTKGAGIYYDNPKKVEKSKLRSEIGCIVEGQDAAVLARLSAKYKVKMIPRGRYLVTEFPHKGKMSVLFGIMKVYPALAKYAEANNLADGPLTEIYDVPNKKIVYLKQVTK